MVPPCLSRCRTPRGRPCGSRWWAPPACSGRCSSPGSSRSPPAQVRERGGRAGGRAGGQPGLCGLTPVSRPGPRLPRTQLILAVNWKGLSLLDQRERALLELSFPEIMSLVAHRWVRRPGPLGAQSWGGGEPAGAGEDRRGPRGRADPGPGLRLPRLRALGPLRPSLREVLRDGQATPLGCTPHSSLPPGRAGERPAPRAGLAPLRAPPGERLPWGPPGPADPRELPGQSHRRCYRQLRAHAGHRVLSWPRWAPPRARCSRRGAGSSPSSPHGLPAAPAVPATEPSRRAGTTLPWPRPVLSPRLPAPPRPRLALWLRTCNRCEGGGRGLRSRARPQGGPGRPEAAALHAARGGVRVPVAQRRGHRRAGGRAPGGPAGAVRVRHGAAGPEGHRCRRGREEGGGHETLRGTALPPQRRLRAPPPSRHLAGCSAGNRPWPDPAHPAAAVRPLTAHGRAGAAGAEAAMQGQPGRLQAAPGRRRRGWEAGRTCTLSSHPSGEGL